MSEEYQALCNNDTWTLVSPIASMKIIGCKWVFKLNYNPDGSVQWHKARLVAKGFHQTPGVDFSETFSPVIKPQQSELSLFQLSHLAGPLNSSTSTMRSSTAT